MKPHQQRRIIGALPAVLAALFFIVAISSIPGFVPDKSAPTDPVITALYQTPEGQPSPSSPTPGMSSDQPMPQSEPLSDRIVEYHISVRLDEASRTLTGTQSVTWHHPGKLPVQDMYFHLYPNAFRGKESTFNRESGGKLREDRMSSDSIGSMTITSLRREDGEDLSHTMRFVQPDDGNEADQTLLKIHLAEPVAPGESITLKMEFVVQLPYVYARMGYAGNFVMAGQWFPKLSVYEPKGRRGNKQEGWNIHQYHGNSEFYSDFGIYNVKIDVPSQYIVAATGFPVKEWKDDGSRRQYHYYAEDVHDFAWAASPDFIYVEEPFSTKHIPGVKIKLYLDPGHEHLTKRYLNAAKRSLASFSEWYGEYPYSTLSIVVPPEDGSGAGGMEYPTLITAWAAKDSEPSLELERVIAHEIGHQFWYGIVASNEFEEAWLDEGFTSYVEDKVMEHAYGITRSLPILSSYITDPAPLKLNAWEYANHRIYAENVYMRASLVLRDIEETIGTKKMQQVLRTYFQRFKFRHPTTQDFQKVLQNVTHRNWDSYFQQFIYGDKMIDYAVSNVTTYPVEQNGVSRYETRIMLHRLGGVHRPVDIAIRLADGTTKIESWNGLERQKELMLHTSVPVSWVLIDPEFKQILEHRHYNNFMHAEVANERQIRWSYALSTFIQSLFGLIAW